MKIVSISIKEFRAFQEKTTIYLANYITCISGHNGTGKSTILAILSNCCELKTSIATHLNGTAFRGDFSDIVVGDNKYDSTGEKVIIEFKDLPSNNGNHIYVEKLAFRAFFQTGGKRYRLIPKKIPGIRETEQKINHPSYYLGLSRLYPVGESKQVTASKSPIQVSEKLVKTHEQIMSLEYGKNTYVTSLKVTESPKKKLGIKNDMFSPIANSSGQDNLSQIILTILSFEQLKEQLGNKYSGGIILIDELDATLHPAAQNKLLDYLYNQAKLLNLQIVFTTHSLSLLEHISDTIKKNKKNDIKIAYLRKIDNQINMLENPIKNFYQHDLFNTYKQYPQMPYPIFILTEDEVARWFLEKILDFKNENPNIKLLDLSISWSHIINLVTSNLSFYQQNHIIILDPDLKKDDNSNQLKKLINGYPIKINQQCSDILILPSENGEIIEEIFWNYVSNLPGNHEFFSEPEIENNNWNKKLVSENGPYSSNYENYENTKTRLKKWFNEHRYYIDFLFKFWAKDNEPIIDDFINLFKSSYNKKYNQLNQ